MKSNSYFAVGEKMRKKQFCGVKIIFFLKKRCSFRSEHFYEIIPDFLGHPVVAWKPIIGNKNGKKIKLTNGQIFVQKVEIFQDK